MFAIFLKSEKEKSLQKARQSSASSLTMSLYCWLMY